MTRARLAVPALVALVLTLLVAPARPAGAADAILGSGSTFAEVALDQWSGDAYRQQGLQVDFAGVGSRFGLTGFQAGTVDFASTDVPYASYDPPPTRAFSYTPIVAGGTALMYYIVGNDGKPIQNLRLSLQTIAGIFFVDIQFWDDPAIKADNPGLDQLLPHTWIRRHVRSSGSGTTGVFTDFLSTIDPAGWANFVGTAGVLTEGAPQSTGVGNYTTTWPASAPGWDCGCEVRSGSNEIAQSIASSTPQVNGAIGYAETAYAIQLGLPVVAIKNAAGNYRLPTARNVAVALLAAVENGDGTQNLEGVFVNARQEAYPVSSYNYLVLPTSGDFPIGKGETLGHYLIYAVTEGQGKAATLGYSPMPPNLVQFALNKVALIPGAPPAPPLGDWGQFYEALEVEKEVPVPGDAPPAITPIIGGAAGDNGWYTSDVHVEWQISSTPPVTSSDGCQPALIGSDTTGTTLTCTASNTVGTATSVVTIKRDVTPPGLPPELEQPLLLGGPGLISPASVDQTSSVAANECSAADTSRVGRSTVVCTTRDRAGNTTTGTVGYRVQYRFEGRLPPDNPDWTKPVDRRAPGRVKLRWTLADAQGHNVGDVLAGDLPVTAQPCSGTGPTRLIRGGLRYRRDGSYVFSWRVTKRERGSCQLVSLDLGEGAVRTITVRFY